MSTTHEAPTTEIAPAPSASVPTPDYQPCDSCGAPLDDRQRYCLTCGTRRRHSHDPAARFLARATQRRQTTPPGAGAAGGRARTAPLAAAGLIVLIPVVLGAGVLIGRSSAGGDAKLIAALRAQKAPVIEYSGSPGPGSTGALASTQSSAGAAVPSKLASTFTLTRGYAIELGTLPAGTSQSDATAAEHADRAKGAPAVGLVSQADFRVTPSPPVGDYVVISGSFSNQAAAQSALAKVKKAFPKALVIRLDPPNSPTPNLGQVLTKTRYGSAHQVVGYKPSAAALAQGKQIAAQDSHNTGQAASGAGLPDIVAVP